MRRTSCQEAHRWFAPRKWLTSAGSTAGDAAVDGLLAGAAAGIAMAAYLVVIGLVAGEGPAVVLARFDPSGRERPRR